MDFAFIPQPGKDADPGILAARQLFRSRLPGSAIVPDTKTNLKDILDWVDTHVPSGQQVSRVFLVSHASDHHVSFLMTPKQKLDSIYEVLVDLQKAGTFTAPARFTAAVPAGGTPIEISIKGCRIGSSEIFLLLLKTLLGGQVQVRAPRHFNGMINISKRSSGFIFDTLTYNIEVHLKDPIKIEKKARDWVKTHTQLVDLFKGAKFLRYDTTQIPDSEIEDALKQLIKPVMINPAVYMPTTTSGKMVKHKLRSLLKFNETVAGSKTHSMEGIAQLRTHRVHRTVARMDNTLFTSKPLMDHVDDAAQLWEQNFKKPTLPGATLEKTFGESLGLNPAEDFRTIVGWDKENITDKKTKTPGKAIVGTYYRYQLLLPITSVTDGSLLFDSERLSGPALTNPTTWPTAANQLTELFRTV